VLRTRTIIILSILTGVALELGIYALSGRREAWDSTQYWTIGLPLAVIASLAIGYLSRHTDWAWTVLVVPAQVTTMMLRSGEIGSLWPLAALLSAFLSLPFVVAAVVGAVLRPRSIPR
jgi:NAD/NADP transhydrogenase beta subunit